MRTAPPAYTCEETEQLILGALVLNNMALAEIELIPEQFYFAIHQQIYAEMLRLFSDKKRFDVTDLYLWAENFSGGFAGMIVDDATPKTYVRWLVSAIVSTVSIPDWAFRIADLARKRRISEALHDAHRNLEVNDSGSVLSDLHRSISENTNVTAVKTQDKTYDEIRERLILPPQRFPTGMKKLDTALGGGLYAGFTYAFCGAEKSGKTTLAHTLSFQLDCPHLYVAMEMGSIQIEQRNIARQIGVNSLAFLENTSMVSEKMKDIKAGSNIFYYDAPGASIDEILFNLSSAIIRYGIKGFIVDYWQLIGGQQRGETEEKHLRRAAQTLADFARKNKVWCILLAQMNKEGQLFGGNGLRKACDQLFMIEECSGVESARWLRMDASRYTRKADIGSADSPGIAIETRTGPFFYDPDTTKLF